MTGEMWEQVHKRVAEIKREERERNIAKVQCLRKASGRLPIARLNSWQAYDRACEDIIAALENSNEQG